MMKSIFCLLACCLCINLFAEWDPEKLEAWEKEAISDIFTTMAEKSVPALIFETFRLTRLGDSIEHVPPLQFLAYLMTDERLKDCIRSIQTSYFKWPPFLEGVRNNMEKEFSAGRLFPDLPHFAKLVKGNYEEMKTLCKKKQWNEFVKSLL